MIPVATPESQVTAVAWNPSLATAVRLLPAPAHGRDGAGPPVAVRLTLAGGVHAAAGIATSPVGVAEAGAGAQNTVPPTIKTAVRIVSRMAKPRMFRKFIKSTPSRCQFRRRWIGAVDLLPVGKPSPTVGAQLRPPRRPPRTQPHSQIRHESLQCSVTGSTGGLQQLRRRGKPMPPWLSTTRGRRCTPALASLPQRLLRRHCPTPDASTHCNVRRFIPRGASARPADEPNQVPARENAVCAERPLQSSSLPTESELVVWRDGVLGDRDAHLT